MLACVVLILVVLAFMVLAFVVLAFVVLAHGRQVVVSSILCKRLFMVAG